MYKLLQTQESLHVLVGRQVGSLLEQSRESLQSPIILPSLKMLNYYF